MNARERKAIADLFDDFTEAISVGMGRTERREALALYMRGLLLEGDRKSVQAMANRIAETVDDTEALRQRLQQCVAVADWDHREMYARLLRMALEKLPGLEAYAIDDTGFVKKGRFSPCVARQYSGTAGRVENCQIATSLHVVGEEKSACLDMELFLPEEWEDDRQRRVRTGIPHTLKHREKWRIALEMLERALENGGEPLPILADAGYGNCLDFRLGIRELGLHYLVAVQGNHLMWPPGAKPAPPKREAGQLGPPTTRDVCEGFDPTNISDLARDLEFTEVTWRSGSKGEQRGWFAATRVYSAERRTKKRNSKEELWLIAEWRKDAQGPEKFYLSSFGPDCSLDYLVRLIKMRWRIERDYQEMKEELGLDHYEGRTWRGIHHHFAICSAAHLFLAMTREIQKDKKTKADQGIKWTLPKVRRLLQGLLIVLLGRCPLCETSYSGPQQPVIRLIM